MRFLGSKFTQNALVAGALPRTPCRFQGAASWQGKGKGGERGGGKGKRGYWGRERGRKGKGRGEGGKGKGGGKGREGEFSSLALGGIDAPDLHRDTIPSTRLQHDEMVFVKR